MHCKINFEMESLRPSRSLWIHGKNKLLENIFEEANFFMLKILYTAFTVLAYCFAICLINKERHYQLPSTPANGHGIILLLFFTLNFISQNVVLFNINSNDWWFVMKTNTDKIEMGLFITRYVGAMFIFVLGFKAPGIQRIAADEDEAILVDNVNENAVSR